MPSAIVTHTSMSLSLFLGTHPYSALTSWGSALHGHGHPVVVRLRSSLNRLCSVSEVTVSSIFTAEAPPLRKNPHHSARVALSCVVPGRLMTWTLTPLSHCERTISSLREVGKLSSRSEAIMTCLISVVISKRVFTRYRHP